MIDVGLRKHPKLYPGQRHPLHTKEKLVLLRGRRIRLTSPKRQTFMLILRPRARYLYRVHPKFRIPLPLRELKSFGEPILDFLTNLPIFRCVPREIKEVTHIRASTRALSSIRSVPRARWLIRNPLARSAGGLLKNPSEILPGERDYPPRRPPEADGAHPRGIVAGREQAEPRKAEGWPEVPKAPRIRSARPKSSPMDST